MHSSSSARPASIVILTLAFILAVSVLPVCAQLSSTSPSPMPFVLLPDSRYEEGCFAPCECPVFFTDGVTGRFTLTFSGFQPPFIVFDVQDINWSVPVLGKTFTGTGQYMIGWTGTAQQQLQADLSENGAPPVRFDSGLAPVTSPLPLIDIAISMNGFYCYDKGFFLKATPADRPNLPRTVNFTIAP